MKSNILSLSAFALVLSLVVAYSPSAMSAHSSYGAGGCGLGSMTLGADGNQIMAMTLNATGMQTFAITSGTSNCTDGGVIRKKHEARVFIELNHHQLATDIAKGHGETVAGLAHLYNCKDENAFGANLQQSYQVIFPSQSVPADQVESAIQNAMSKTAGNCQG